MNNSLIFYFIFLILSLLAFIVGYYISTLKNKATISQLSEKEKGLQEQLVELKKNFQNQITDQKEQFTNQILKLEEDNTKSEQEREESNIKAATLFKENEILGEKLEEQKEDLTKLNEKFTKEFENLANKILEEKSEKFVAKNQEQMTSILNPFSLAMREFKEKVEKANDTNIAQHASLKQQIESLSILNDKIGKEAENLTKALKGDSKMQGDWGELILEKLLESSGLVKNQEYFLQESFLTSENRNVRLDARLVLPDKKNIIIDSKVSLNSYITYVNSEDSLDKSTALKGHLLSVKKHIKDLSEKNYPEIPVNTLDFTIMFLPVESAYISAVQNDLQLFNEALKKNIILAAPSTLLAMLKTIQNVWRRENQNQNVMEIAKRAGNLYDKFNSLLEEFEKSERQFTTFKNSFYNIETKLKGKGNLISQVEKIKTLGAETNKQISSHWFENREGEE